MSREEEYWEKFFAWKRGEIRDPPRPPEEMRPKKKPPRKVREKKVDEVPEELVEPFAMPPEEIEFGEILEKFKGLSDEKKFNRRMVLDETLELAERAEEDPKIKASIEEYQERIVNSALRMLTLPNIPRLKTSKTVQKLKKQVSRVIEPETAPYMTGLRYNWRGIGELLMLPRAEVEKEYTPTGEF